MIRARVLAPLALLGCLALPALASAHPLGNFTVNHYSRLEPLGDTLRVTYVLDLAKIPTLQEQQSAIDTDADGQVSQAEQDAYAARKAEDVGRNLTLSIDGAPAALQPVAHSLSFPAGQGGLPTLRLEATYAAALTGGSPLDIEYRDANYPDRIGWKEIVVRAGQGASILQSDAPDIDQSDMLRQYPQDMLTSPLDRTQAHFRAQATGSGALAAPLAAVAPATSGLPADAYAALVAQESLTPVAVLLALLAAAFWGSLHALTPGHGKTVVAAYLVGARGTAEHAAFLGLTVTATHTLGVYALGLVTLFAAQYVLPERIYPWLGTISGLVVVVMGATLLGQRLRSALRPRRAVAHASSHAHAHAADHGHAHGHDHGQAHGHDHADHDHTHAPQPALAVATPQFALVGAGAGGGTVAWRAPSAVDEHAYAHARGLSHAHAQDRADAGQAYGHDHGDQAHAHGPAGHHGHDHDADAADDHGHHHGPGGHSHLPPGADGSAVTWRSLLALGVSGGLLPCPSALVVMLGAIALGRVAFGLALVLAFSLGLAAVLIALGVLLVYAGKLFQRVPTDKRVFRLIPVGSAAVILVLGVILTMESLAQTGLL